MVCSRVCCVGVMCGRAVLCLLMCRATEDRMLLLMLLNHSHNRVTLLITCVCVLRVRILCCDVCCVCCVMHAVCCGVFCVCCVLCDVCCVVFCVCCVLCEICAVCCLRHPLHHLCRCEGLNNTQHTSHITHQHIISTHTHTKGSGVQGSACHILHTSPSYEGTHHTHIVHTCCTHTARTHHTHSTHTHTTHHHTTSPVAYHLRRS